MAEQVSELKAEVEEMRRMMAGIERKHRNELLELEQKHRAQGEIVSQMMENATAANEQLTRVQDQVGRLNVQEDLSTLDDHYHAKEKKETETVKVPVGAQNNVVPRQNLTGNNVFPAENLMPIPQMTCFDLSVQNGKARPDFVWQINDVARKINSGSFKDKSRPFKWSGYPVQSKVKMSMKEDGLIHVTLSLTETPEPLNSVQLVPSVFYVLRDQTAKSQLHRVRVTNVPFATPFHRALTYPCLLTHKFWLGHQLYRANDSVLLEVYVEPPALTPMARSLDGTLRGAIDRYAQRRHMAKEKLVSCQESPYLYTGPRGYRVQVKMWLDGLAGFAGKGLTAQVSFLTGAFDQGLPLTFPHLTTITLFDRKQPARSVTKTLRKDILVVKHYLVDVCTFEELDSLVDNDVVYFQVTIKPDN